ncbi:ACT domain-containing protein [Cynara cardunculus var. scolymus]|uniref:Arogenate dehydratase n=1 Tax=Cynara cardunculus var. scolymus TaxID=59895 RepID=A0A103XB42_CYNCS|nr:ACT domain-containing protein [Cynara cardunculus var. scolymus]
MALKAVPIWVCVNHSLSQLGLFDFVQNKKKTPAFTNCRVNLSKFRKWECLGLKLAEPERAQTHVEDDKPLSPSDLGSTSTDERIQDTQITESKGFHKDLNSLPKPLSATDLAVELWLVDKAVLPIENSVGGSIHRNYDLLLRHRLHIVGEVQMVVNHCLLGVPGVKKEELKRVLSHPQIVASEGIRDTGAVASSRAAEIYGLDILAQTIQDDLDNVTRFLILAREPIIPGPDKPYKTSIVFTLEEGPGVLFKALAVFALREINLSKIESRPQRKRPLRIVDDSNKGSAKYFDYLFYIDFEASMAEPRAQYALGHLQEFARFIRVLGCYPMDTTI